MSNTGIARLVGLGVVALFALITFFSSFGQIQAGNVGVVTQFGAVQMGEIKHEGLYSIIPFVQKVHQVDAKPHKIEVNDESAVTSDRQAVKTSIALVLQIDPNQADKVYREYREDIVNTVVMPKLLSAVKTITAKYDAKTQVVQRGMVQAEMLAYIQHELEGTGVLISADALSITNFSYNDDYQKALEDTQVAQQNLIKAEAELKVNRIEADQKIAAARGEAQSQALLAHTITEKSLQYEFYKHWDGKLPLVTGGNNIMDISSLVKDSK